MEDASALVFAAELMASSTVPATANLQIFDGTLFLSPSTPTLDSSGVAEAEVVVGAAVAHPFELGTGKLDFGPRAAPLARVAPIAPPRKSAAHVVNGFSPSSQTDSSTSSDGSDESDHSQSAMLPDIITASLSSPPAAHPQVPGLQESSPLAQDYVDAPRTARMVFCPETVELERPHIPPRNRPVVQSGPRSATHPQSGPRTAAHLQQHEQGT
ncbi:hypothetical protein T484DRAFT_1847411 [Baffinella frigidus]|nr:hypothetical protein T484DRAFT_1847411 [Cryptophyta sp. CCMP2293]